MIHVPLINRLRNIGGRKRQLFVVTKGIVKLISNIRRRKIISSFEKIGNLKIAVILK